MTMANSPLAQLQRTLEAMPPVRAMAVRAMQTESGCLRLVAPLAANVNDKGCAFGGSLSGLMTLAAWAELSVRLHAAGIVAEVYVATCEVTFRAPVYETLVAEAVLEPDQDWAAILTRLRARGRARARMTAQIVMADARSGAEMQASFALVATAA